MVPVPGCDRNGWRTGRPSRSRRTSPPRPARYVHVSLWEEQPGRPLGFNTAIVVAPDRSLLARTRKLHLPITAGYYEDRYFEPGPPQDAYRHPAHR